jgi:hypothetical protein
MDMMSNKCPPFNKEAFVGAVNTINEQLIAAGKTPIKDQIAGPCPPTFGGKRGTKKRRSKTMRGGQMLRRDYIRYMLYVIIAIMTGYGFASDNFRGGIIPGLIMVRDGTCADFGNVIWGALGLQNPVCELWNRLRYAIPNAIMGNTDGIFLLGKILGGGVAIAAGRPIDRLVDLIEDRIDAAGNLIPARVENGAANQVEPGAKRGRPGGGKRTKTHRK